ncbi:MAG: FkbM family methyltransferase [Gammaproteobacteria bacterium]|nr:FkbM family methyltransferase [Gammaproteobacteria bacterium]
MFTLGVKLVMGIIKKIKRELIVLFSKICIKSARNDYLGLDLKYPIIYGMGRGYVIPKEIWMGECLKAFIHCKEGCVIDVGVNVGVYLVKLKVLTDKVEYFGFEPNAVCNYYTNELIRMNDFKHARVLPLALSDKMGVQVLYANKLGDKTASLVYETKNSADLEYSSDIVTVKGDDFIELLNIKQISVIKVDVEGAEFFVLNGLLDTIEKFRPFFYIEIWASENDKSNGATGRISDIYNLITSKDYTILGANSERVLEIMDAPEDILGQCDPNYIFVPNELLKDFKSAIKNSS